MRDGSLRGCAGELGIPVILYEAGEALRFDEVYIRAGVNGIINVMRQIGMLPSSRASKPPKPPLVCDQTHWMRAPESGILRTLVPLGAKVDKDQVLALIADPLGSSETEVLAPCAGVIIGRTRNILSGLGENAPVDPAVTQRDIDWMPVPDGLQEQMTEAEFKRRFGGIEGAGYQQTLGDIKRRIDSVALYR